MSSYDLEDLADRAAGDAFVLAFSAHSGQTDRLGDSYIGHVVRVASNCPPEAVVVALLHDVVEDTDVGLARIEAGFGARTARAVDAISRREGENEDAYLARVASDELAMAVKRADLADNSDPNRLARLDPETRDQLAAKYAHAKRVLGFD